MVYVKNILLISFAAILFSCQSSNLVFEQDKVEKLQEDERQYMPKLIEEGDESQGRVITKSMFVVGDTIADMKVQEFKGETQLFSKFRNNKYTLIDVWGTWCLPCIKQFPHIREVYTKIDKSKINFISVCYDSDNEEERIANLIKKYQLEWTQLIDKDGSFIDFLQVEKFPTIYLLDPEGKVLATNKTEKGLNDNLLAAINKYIN